jgi:hypothetical protein
MKRSKKRKLKKKNEQELQIRLKVIEEQGILNLLQQGMQTTLQNSPSFEAPPVKMTLIMMIIFWLARITSAYPIGNSPTTHVTTSPSRNLPMFPYVDMTTILSNNLQMPRCKFGSSNRLENPIFFNAHSTLGARLKEQEKKLIKNLNAIVENTLALIAKNDPLNLHQSIREMATAQRESISDFSLEEHFYIAPIAAINRLRRMVANLSTPEQQQNAIKGLNYLKNRVFISGYLIQQFKEKSNRKEPCIAMANVYIYWNAFESIVGVVRDSLLITSVQPKSTISLHSDTIHNNNEKNYQGLGLEPMSLKKVHRNLVNSVAVSFFPKETLSEKIKVEATTEMLPKTPPASKLGFYSLLGTVILAGAATVTAVTAGLTFFKKRYTGTYLTKEIDKDLKNLNIDLSSETRETSFSASSNEDLASNTAHLLNP